MSKYHVKRGSVQGLQNAKHWHKLLTFKKAFAIPWLDGWERKKQTNKNWTEKKQTKTIKPPDSEILFYFWYTPAAQLLLRFVTMPWQTVLLKIKLIPLCKMCTSCMFAQRASLFLSFQLAKGKVWFLVNAWITTIKMGQFSKYQVAHFRQLSVMQAISKLCPRVFHLSLIPFRKAWQTNGED